MKKFVSVLLIAAALVGFIGGGTAVKGVVETASYYKEMGASSGDSIQMLEDGLATLKENEPAYVQGKEALEQGKIDYEAGLKALEEGKKAYDEGKATLEAKQAEYDAGVAALAEAEKKLEAGRQTLLRTWGDYNEGSQAYDNGKAQLSNAEQQLAAAKAQLDANRAAYEAGKKQIDSLDEATITRMTTAYNAVNTVMGNGLSYEDAVAYVAANYGLSEADVNAGYAGYQSYMNGKALIAQYEAGLAQYNQGMAAYGAGQSQLAEGKEQLQQWETGYSKYKRGAEQIEAARAQLEEGAKQLEEGWKSLAEAEQQLKDGEAQLEQAKKQIADGEAQLAQFEEGRDQAIAGLETVLATESSNGLPSIADRLGADYSYMKNDTDIDYDKAQEAVDAARAYAADTTEFVTKNLVSKAVAGAVLLASALFGAIAGILGLAGKGKASAVLGLITLLAGAAALFVAIKAGGGADLMTVGSGATAFTGLLGAIFNGAKAKAAV